MTPFVPLADFGPGKVAPITDLAGLKFLVVGAGFYGAVMAERIASVLNERVVVIDVRNHIGGNSFSYADDRTNIEIHAYGSHIFHTSNETVWNYLTSFAKFNSYIHRVYTVHDGAVYSMPINLHTINQFFRRSFNPGEAREFIQQEVRNALLERTDNLEEKAISLVGKRLYEALIKGYTEKQWGTSPARLPARIITRLPVRFDYNNRYFSDKWEGQPIGGYGALFGRMLGHRNISLHLGVDFFAMRDRVPPGCRVIYTGPIDRYFDYRLGVLGWRSIRLKWRSEATDDFQGTSVMNYADLDVPFTRIHEFKHYHPERAYPLRETIICEEHPLPAGKDDDPCYPVSADADKRLFSMYKELAMATRNAIFGGRLGNYVYIDMHQAVAMALGDFDRFRVEHCKVS
jgi:UDP-galactopyranose mutase